MNPKAMPRQQLLGHIDMDTREWADGVLTHSARSVVREPQGEYTQSTSMGLFKFWSQLPLCGRLLGKPEE